MELVDVSDLLSFLPETLGLFITPIACPIFLVLGFVPWQHWWLRLAMWGLAALTVYPAVCLWWGFFFGTMGGIG